MNSINNNISNSNYGFENNNNSNNKKEEESFFDKVLDSISDFFTGDEEEENKEKVASSNNLDKAYMMKLQSSNTYTLAPMKNQETLTEKWARENESVELKQKEKEIAKLQQNINALKSKNKLLEKQNELMFQNSQPNQVNRTNTQAMSPSAEANSIEQTQTAVAPQSKGLPTHTSIPKAVLEQQQSEIDDLAAKTKVEAPKETIKEDDTKAMASSNDTTKNKEMKV